MGEKSRESPLTASVWHRPLVPEDAKDRQAKRKGNAAVALLRLGREQKVWPLLQHCPDPRTRSYLIHRFGPLGADARQVLTQLDTQEEVSTRRALILVLAEFSEQQLPHHERAQLIPRLLDLYANDPDPGIHGAVAWTLRQWKMPLELRKIDQRFATGAAEGKRRWYVNHQGQNLVIFAPPGETIIGSPPYEIGREDGPEGRIEEQRYVRIGYAFALMSQPVTVADFLRFRKEFLYRKRYSPESDCPINSVSWFDAVAYCNWLNELENIPQEQWCYLPNERGEYALGMKVAADFVQRTGYRLPAEAEWEFACRAGTTTSRYYGQGPDLDDYYAWTVHNSLGRWTTAVGSFKPNDFGLFDMLGNIMEWCHDEFRDHAKPAGDKDGQDQAHFSLVTDDQGRTQKSPSLVSCCENIRSAYCYRGFPNSRIYAFGFRMGRTCFPNEDPSAREVRHDRSRAMKGAHFVGSSDILRSAYQTGLSPNMRTYGFGMRPARTVE
jgi:formylglycine-generating enzyme required for sulfatase activity